MAGLERRPHFLGRAGELLRLLLRVWAGCSVPAVGDGRTCWGCREGSWWQWGCGPPPCGVPGAGRGRAPAPWPLGLCRAPAGLGKGKVIRSMVDAGVGRGWPAAWLAPATGYTVVWIWPQPILGALGPVCCGAQVLHTLSSRPGWAETPLEPGLLGEATVRGATGSEVTDSRVFLGTVLSKLCLLSFPHHTEEDAEAAKSHQSKVALM